MDYNAFVFFTVLGFAFMLFGYIFKKTGLGTAFNTLALLLFVSIGLLLAGGTQITVMVYTDSLILLPVDLGVDTQNLALVYLSLALVAFYLEF